jgi:hypothetical protein
MRKELNRQAVGGWGFTEERSVFGPYCCQGNAQSKRGSSQSKANGRCVTLDL